MGKVCRAKVAERVRLGADHARIGRAVELPASGASVCTSWSASNLEGVSHESFVFTSSTFSFSRTSRTRRFIGRFRRDVSNFHVFEGQSDRTKAVVFTKRVLELSWGRFAVRRLHEHARLRIMLGLAFHNFNFHFLKDASRDFISVSLISSESFVFTS